MVLKIILLFITGLFTLRSFCQIGQGTTILVFINKDTISIAADSKRTFIDFDGNKKIVAAKKIWNVGEIFYFMSGITSVVDNESPTNDTIFSAFKIMHYFLLKEKQIDKAFALFNDSVKRKLTLIIRESLNKYDYLKPSNLFEAGMVQMLNGVPKFRFFKYNANKNDFTVTAKEDLPNGSISFPFVKGLGHYLVAYKYAKIYLPVSKNNKDLLTKMVKLEIDNDSAIVGGPINVVSIYKKGHKWYPPVEYSPLNKATH